jgi:2'-5' RNA ligase
MRLFAGVPLPKEALAAVQGASLPLKDALGVRMVAPENLHITLCFIGNVEDAKLARVADALCAVRFSPFSISLSGAGAFPNRHFPRAIWIGGKSEGAEKLAASVCGALPFLPLKREKFSAHLTVARSNSAGDIEDFLQKTGEVCSFYVRSFVLVRSKLTPVGPVYEVIKEFPAQDG